MICYVSERGGGQKNPAGSTLSSAAVGGNVTIPFVLESTYLFATDIHDVYRRDAARSV